MKTILATIATFGMLAAPTLRLEGVARAQQKIAYVDIQRALGETEEGKATFAKLKAEKDKKQKELDARQEEVKKEMADVEKQSGVLKPDALQQKRMAVQQKALQWQEAAMRAQDDLNKKQATELQRIIDKLQAIVAQMAQAEGYTYVLDKSGGIVYAPQSLDLTNELIRKYNATSHGGSGAAGKAK